MRLGTRNQPPRTDAPMVPAPTRYEERLDMLLAGTAPKEQRGQRVGAGVITLLDRRVQDLNPADHYLHGSLRAAEAVILEGHFTPGNQHSSEESVNEGRRLTIEAAKGYVREKFEERGGRPLWALSWAAAYYALTGEKCWDESEEAKMKEDSEQIIRDNASRGSRFHSADTAANYRLAFNEEIWTPEERDFMAAYTLEDLRKYAHDHQTHVNAFGSPGTVALSSRAADLRVIQAEEIRPVTGDPSRGIEIIDPPFIEV